MMYLRNPVDPNIWITKTKSFSSQLTTNRRVFSSHATNLEVSPQAAN